MKPRWYLLLGLVLSVTLLLNACASFSSPQDSTSGAPAAVPSDESTPPEVIVERFYEWYLDYARSEGNPLEDGAYRSSEYLSPSLIERVGGMLGSFAGAAYDPFLCTQDLPEYVSVEEVSVSGGIANVVVSSNFPDYSLTVELKLFEGEWKIDYILCGGSAYACSDVESDCDEAESSGPGPEAVVEDFYAWYFDYARSQGNPLTDRAYCACEYLSIGFVERVDRLLDSEAPYDPFICGQDLPESVTVEEAVVSGDTASVVVQTSFPGHSFETILELVEGEWRIVDILCAAR
jgi:hypothetical protein